MLKIIKRFFEPKPDEDFQVRSITLKDGTTLFFPEYKQGGFSSSWQTIILVNCKHYIAVDLHSSDLEYSCSSEGEAEDYCRKYKELLQAKRAKEVKSEVVKVLTI